MFDLMVEEKRLQFLVSLVVLWHREQNTRWAVGNPEDIAKRGGQDIITSFVNSPKYHVILSNDPFKLSADAE